MLDHGTHRRPLLRRLSSSVLRPPRNRRNLSRAQADVNESLLLSLLSCPKSIEIIVIHDHFS